METCFIVWLSVLFNITTMFIMIFHVKSNFTKPRVNTEARSFNTLNTSLKTEQHVSSGSKQLPLRLSHQSKCHLLEYMT